MSTQHVRKWCRDFKEGRTDVHHEQRGAFVSGQRSSVHRPYHDQFRWDIVTHPSYSPDIAPSESTPEWNVFCNRREAEKKRF